MAKENLSQRVLLELLTKEIETLKKATSIVKHSVNDTGGYVQKIEGYLGKIQSTKIPVDPTSLDKALKSVDFQRKAIIWVFAMGLLMSAAIFSGVLFYQKAEKMEDTARYWQNQAIELGYEKE